MYNTISFYDIANYRDNLLISLVGSISKNDLHEFYLFIIYYALEGEGEDTIHNLSILKIF